MATKTETKRNFSGGYAGEKMSYRFRYQFADSGGATADTFELAEADKKFIITKYMVHVTEQCTSGGSAVVTIGTDGDPDAMVDATAGAVANLTADALIDSQAAGENILMQAGDKLELSIATAALTAGSISVYIEGYAA